MPEGQLRLLGSWSSPFVIRVRMALEQKGLSYQYHVEDFPNKSELLLKYNPIHKKIPVLIHGDRSVCESLVMLQYIDENWPGAGPPLLPADPFERAMARFWAVYIDDKFRSAFVGIIKAATKEIKAEKINETIGTLEQLERAFKECSGGKSFFGGDSIGFVDLTLGCDLIWIKAVENISGAKLLDETKVPLLVEWANRFLAVDFVKLIQPSVEKMEEFVIMLQTTVWNSSSA